MEWEGKCWSLKSGLVGAHNASNLLAAQAVALGIGLGPADMQPLAAFTGVPGRLQRVNNAHDLDVFVDYAHTPDALINVQRALRDAGFKRLITVFGCGGNRDKTKRPLMGDVGSLALGGTLGFIAVLSKQELILALVGGVFVFETLSVILQVGYFKMSGGKRIFRMAGSYWPISWLDMSRTPCRA